MHPFGGLRVGGSRGCRKIFDSFRKASRNPGWEPVLGTTEYFHQYLHFPRFRNELSCGHEILFCLDPPLDSSARRNIPEEYSESWKPSNSLQLLNSTRNAFRSSPIGQRRDGFIHDESFCGVHRDPSSSLKADRTADVEDRAHPVPPLSSAVYRNCEGLWWSNSNASRSQQPEQRLRQTGRVLQATNVSSMLTHPYASLAMVKQIQPNRRDSCRPADQSSRAHMSVCIVFSSKQVDERTVCELTDA